MPEITVAAPAPAPVAYVGGAEGAWAIERVEAVRGASLDPAPRLAVLDRAGPAPLPADAWTLRGVISHLRYATSMERAELAAGSLPLGRPEATCAALIPIRKSARWWGLAQDERRAILAAQSHHIAIGMEYMPAVARQLAHCRDLGEPWDFLTWFEFAPPDAGAFDQLLARLRASEEWRHVEREAEVRLIRTA